MERSRYQPEQHLFVCVNRRDGSDLGPGCGAGGEAVYAALRPHASYARWVTRTQCLGICPREGTAIAIYTSAGIGNERAGLYTCDGPGDIHGILENQS